jgi:hypothetical protein
MPARRRLNAAESLSCDLARNVRCCALALIFRRRALRGCTSIVLHFQLQNVALFRMLILLWRLRADEVMGHSSFVICKELQEANLINAEISVGVHHK